MGKRDSAKLLQLFNEFSKKGSASEDANTEPTRKRKRGRGAGGLAELVDGNIQWRRAPMVHHIAGKANQSFQTRYLHHATLSVPVQPNVLREDNVFSHFDITPPWMARYPVPLYCPPGPGPTVPDLMVRYLITKDNYERELVSIHQAYKRIETHHTLLNLQLRKVKESDRIENSAAIIYAELLERNPDPFLSLEYGYDYHFTGGSMAFIQHGAEVGGGAWNGRHTPVATVFTAVGESLENMDIIQLTPSSNEGADEIEAKKVAHFNLTNIPGPVLEITVDAGGHWILVRKRHSIVVFREISSTEQQLEDVYIDETEFRPVQHLFSTVPFASVCIVMADSWTPTVCTTDHARRLRLWEIDHNLPLNWKDHKKKRLPKFETPLQSNEQDGKKDDDTWSVVKCIDGRSLLGCLDRDQIYFYTLRDEQAAGDCSDESGETQKLPPPPLLQLDFRGSSGFSQWIMPCERPCALEVAPAEQLIFVATCHKLLIAKVDHQRKEHSERMNSRQYCEETEGPSRGTFFGINVLIVFTHNLLQRPAFISYQRHAPRKYEPTTADDETKKPAEQHFLLFGSHLPMSYGICSFEKSSLEGLNLCSAAPTYHTRYLPLQPPTFGDAYKLTQERAFCLSAYEPLRHRFVAACQSGMALIATGKGGLHIILQTSGGDLLQQNICNPPTDAGQRERLRSRAEETRVAETIHRWHEQLLECTEQPRPYRAQDFRTLKKFRDIFNSTHEPDELKDLFLKTPPKKSHKKKPNPLTTDSGRAWTSSSSRNGSDSSDLESSASADSFAADGLQTTSEPPPPPWRQTLDELQQYKDVLAPTMLAVWSSDAGIANAEGIFKQIPTKLPPYEDVTERVQSWVTDTLSTNSQLPVDEEEKIPEDPESTTLKLEQLQTLETQMNNHHPLGQDITAIPADQAPEPQAKQKTNASVVRPAKKKYVKGF